MTIEDRRWEILKGYLEVPEWSQSTAAHLLIGLDPEQTELRSDRYQGSYFWLPESVPDDFPARGASYGLREQFDHNVEMRCNWIFSLTRRADIKVRTPQQWISWSVDIRAEPPWLKKAYGRSDIFPMLPVDLPAYKSPAVGAAETTRSAGKMGGHRKHAAGAGQSQEYLRPLIHAWFDEGCPGTAVRKAEELQERLEAMGLPGLTVLTIEKYIRAIRKERRNV